MTIQQISNINILIGLKDIVSNKKRYLSIALMMVLLTFVMIVPQNIYTTINSPSFMGYMGIGEYDIRFDIQQVDEIEEKVLLISSQLENDSNISNYSVSYSKIFRALDSNDEVEMIKIELGNHTIFPIPYTSGKFPEGEKEIALSSNLSSDFNKQVGDSIVILIDEIPTEFVITGIYSDLTNGGRTAKATFLNTSADILWSTIGASVENQELLPEIVETYSDTYSFAKITSVEEYGSQLFASMFSAVLKSVYLSIVIVFLITFLIISLFLNLIIKKEKNEIANMKAMGFTQKDFDIQYITKIILPAFIGVLFGVLFSNTVGEKLSGLLLAFLGVSGFRFAVNVFLVYFIYPFILLLTVVIAIMFTLRSIRKIDISSYIRDQ